MYSKVIQQRKVIFNKKVVKKLFLKNLPLPTLSFYIFLNEKTSRWFFHVPFYHWKSCQPLESILLWWSPHIKVTTDASRSRWEKEKKMGSSRWKIPRGKCPFPYTHFSFRNHSRLPHQQFFLQLFSYLGFIRFEKSKKFSDF